MSRRARMPGCVCYFSAFDPLCRTKPRSWGTTEHNEVFAGAE